MPDSISEGDFCGLSETTGSDPEVSLKPRDQIPWFQRHLWIHFNDNFKSAESFMLNPAVVSLRPRNPNFAKII
jgi:hypothetical protein